MFESSETAGGHLALEFTNTLSWDPDDPVGGEKIGTYRQLLDWSLDRGLISRKTHGVLAAKALHHPEDATGAHEQAVALRAAMHEIFTSYAGDAADPPAGAVAVFDEALAALPLRLILSGAGARWDWSSPDNLAALTWPVTWSAVSLLTSPDLAMVKQCAGERCGWLFVDESRRHNRKWCDMRDCGNRAKARRHYYRHRRSS